jgi:tripartite-type tricarboxylate transporter receptor subunit TctC
MPGFTASRRLLLASTVSAALARPALAQDGTLRLIVGFAPGGGTDVLARVFAERFSAALGQPVIVENRAGGGGVVGAQAVARAAPDGNTLLISPGTALLVAEQLGRTAGATPGRELAPLAMVATQPLLFTVRSDSAVRALTDLRGAAAGRRGGINIGSPGSGTELHLAGVLLARELGIEMTHLPYRSGGLAITALLSGQLDLLPVVTSSIRGHVQSGTVRALATSYPRRLPDFPDVPTTAELGLGAVNIVPWWALFAPPAMPDQITARLLRAVVAVTNDTAYRERLAGLSIIGAGAPDGSFGDVLAAERAAMIRLFQAVPALREME